jgi:hypothetical protein
LLKQLAEPPAHVLCTALLRLRHTSAKPSGSVLIGSRSIALLHLNVMKNGTQQNWINPSFDHWPLSCPVIH